MNKRFKRVFVIVLDSFGIGYAPDADKFGDIGANTLLSISKSKKFDIPNLLSLGLGNIDGVDFLKSVGNPSASYGRLLELSAGKDTTIGHFELMGLYSERPLPTYKDGFPKEVIEKFEKATGRGVLCNKPYSGTDVIRDYGKEHIETGKLIVYTSADSVFQIAAHENTVPLGTLYEYCRIAREILVGKHGVGRVIARPFLGEEGSFYRTQNRRDFSITPPRRTALDAIKENRLQSIAIGKISDIFANQGITKSFYTHGNDEGIQKTLELMKSDFSGLCFTNLVDFDMLYGHRQDSDGYAKAISEFDLAVPGMLSLISEDDCLIITADHGCDPSDSSTDHTREYVPLLVYSKSIRSKSIGTVSGFGAVANLTCDMLGVSYTAEKSERIELF